MNKSTISILCLLTLGMGALVYVIQYELIIIRFWQPIVSDHLAKHTKKKIDLYYWDTQRWHKESQEILWSQKAAANLQAIISSWLALIDAERITAKKVSLQVATLTPSNQEALISFDRTPFAKSWSIQKKWMLIEGLLRTVRENNLTINSIQFLVEHQPLIDPHLDFSTAWPIHGFIQLQ